MENRKQKEKFAIIDWFGFCIGVVVTSFLVFILIWPLIDPTPEKSSTLQENVEKLSPK
ncbi:hypothetical protein [Nitrospina watsonii]|uniref:Uncharacterized protein n=1 Tax=Nitrospina watsonii TaxID=1323948 RepID=A0ABM9HBW9_9BACT|nr:hypothetical protein [Nitrospina watsonii]CAI2717599.1 protein of unknown function [Nitrospina watsonii]